MYIAWMERQQRMKCIKVDFGNRHMYLLETLKLGTHACHFRDQIFWEILKFAQSRCSTTRPLVGLPHRTPNKPRLLL